MYVEKLAMVNIRSYPFAQIEFSKGINIIAGRNNSGKSTVLRALQNLQIGLSGFTKEDVRKTQDAGKLYIKISDIKASDGIRFEFQNEKIETRESQDIFFAFFNSKTNSASEGLQLPGGIYNITFSENDISIIDSKGRASGPFYKKFSGFTSMEDEDNFIYPFLAKRKTNTFNGQGGRQSAYEIRDQLYNLPSRIQSLENRTHPFHADYIAFTEDVLGFTPGKVPSNQGNEDKIGVFGRGRDSIYIDSMGDGVVNILGLLSVLLTEDHKLFLIEELENDIHPEALKKLLNIIIEKSKYNQFIITTHSNIVLKYLASVPGSKVFYTDWHLKEFDDRPKYYLPTSSIAEVGNSENERIAVLEKLGYDLFDFDLYSSYILFEESSAESVVRQFLIPTFFPSLENKIKTIAARGVDDVEPRFHDFLRLFVYIHTNPIYFQKAWVIVDGDNAGQKVIQGLKDTFKWPDGHFINLKENDFEHYYPDEFKNRFIVIDQEKDKQTRRSLKKELTQDLLKWISENSDEAKIQFSKSAKEVLDILGNINLELYRSKK